MTLHHGDCLEVMRGMDDNGVDSIVTDPPYGLSFMGKKWDYDVPSAEIWRECLRVLKPGGHLLCFAGTRTQHRMAVRIEDAGFEIRDMIAWVYGSGFPKSLNIGKAIDKAAGAEREVVGEGAFAARRPRPGNGSTIHMPAGDPITAPATAAAKQWDGWGTALKPAMEPVTVARKPLIGTVAENVLEWGTGGINVDGCRVGTEKEGPGAVKTGKPIMAESWLKKHGHGSGYGPREMDQSGMNPNIGRWPANLIHDGSDEVVGLFPVTTGGRAKPATRRQGSDGKNNTWIYGAGIGKYSAGQTTNAYPDGDTGSASRFFYCAKASKADRDEGCQGLEAKANADWPQNLDGDDARGAAPRRNHHPTVKPTDLMRYLCRLVTPPGGIILDPFMGSGSTGKAAMLEGFRFIGIERDADYIEIARARINAVKQGALL
jgi:site-specific DNA-methyltransferase (adenine-specific)